MVLRKSAWILWLKITNKKKEILPGFQEHNYAVDGKVHFYVQLCGLPFCMKH